MIRNYVTLIGVVLRVGSAAMAHSGGFSSHYKCVFISYIRWPFPHHSSLLISPFLLNIDARCFMPRRTHVSLSNTNYSS